MKAKIHLIPTDKPSRLAILHDDKLHLGTKFINDYSIHPQNIYITSDEEIKEGDWCYNSINNTVYKKELNKLSFAYEYKIILTTEQDLIKDGVQAIDDDFLEWFVNNPNCEWIDFELINDIEHWYKLLELRSTPMVYVPNESMYSEEDVERIANEAYNVGKHGGINETYYDFKEWFEQFKKKK